MKCKNCGSEIPDGAMFCGVCGTRVEPEEAPAAPAAPETPVVETPVVPAAPETPVVPEAPAAPVQPTPVQPAAPAQPAQQAAPAEQQTLGSEIGNSLKDSAAGKVILGDNGKLDKGDFVRMGNAAVQGAETAYKSISWDEFKTFGAVFMDPFGEHPLGLAPSIVVTIVTFIINCWALKSILNGLFFTAIVYGAGFLVLYINKEKDANFDGKNAYGRTCQILTIPVCAMFIVCLAGMALSPTALYSALENSISNSLSSSYSSLFGSSSSSSSAYASGVAYANTLRTTLIIVMIFLVFAGVTYCAGMFKANKKLHGYLLAGLVTIVAVLCIYWLFTGLINSYMTSAMSMFGSLSGY